MAKSKLDELLEASAEALEKGQDLGEIKADHHGKGKGKVKTQKEKVGEKVRQAKQKKDVEVKDVEEQEKKASVPADKQEAKSAEAKGEVREKQGKAKIRSKKYQVLYSLIDPKKKYEIVEALELVKKTSMTKFDGNVEVHIRLLGKSGKPEQVRGLLQYPHPTGKKIEVAVLDDKTIEEIEKSGKADADIYLTTPAQMPKVAKLAKILGPKGKMPNPKAGTIVEDIEKAKAELAGGKVEYKTDTYGSVHQVIGKVSGKSEDLQENFKELISVLPIEKAVSITLCATMGPGVKVSIK